MSVSWMGRRTRPSRSNLSSGGPTGIDPDDIPDDMAGSLGESGQTGLSESVVLDDRENALDEVCVLLERFDNRLTLINLALVKRYADGDINVLLEAKWGSIDFNIVFQQEDRAESRWSGGSMHERGMRAAAGDEVSTFRIDSEAGHAGANHHLDGCRCYRQTKGRAPEEGRSRTAIEGIGWLLWLLGLPSVPLPTIRLAL